MLEYVLNPSDPRPAYMQIADALRGAYQPGVQLDPTDALAVKWNVAKQTVRAAIDELRKENLVVSWQGRGVFYRAAEPAEQAGDEPAVLDRILTRLEDFDLRLSALERSQPQARRASESDAQAAPE